VIQPDLAISLGISKATSTDHTQRALQVNGSSDQPRLAVYRSNNHIYAQVWFFGNFVARQAYYHSSWSQNVNHRLQ